MTVAERTGFGVALAGHVALFAALSLGFLAAPKPIVPVPAPIDVQLVDEVGLRDTAPVVAQVEPAASIAPELGPVEEAAAPAPAPVAQPVPKQVAKPVSVKPAPAKPAQERPRGSRLGADFLKGITDRNSTSTSQTPRAAAGPAVEASLAREVLRQLKPHWKAPTGADAEQLRTLLSIRLDKTGAVTAVSVLETRGVTESNRGQVALHNEQAIKAVRLASPFQLPADLYETWKTLEPVGFDRRL